MDDSRGYRIEPFGHNRKMVAASLAVNRETDTIHIVTEVDITEPRRLISEHRDRTGERLSLTGYVVTCLARTLDQFPRFNAFRKGNRLVVLHDGISQHQHAETIWRRWGNRHWHVRLRNNVAHTTDERDSDCGYWCDRKAPDDH